MTETPTFTATDENAPRPDLPFVERNAITAVIRDPDTGTYLGLRWKKVDWETFVTGGIEPGQTAEQAARMEALQETGFTELRLVATLPGFDAKFYHGPKKENRWAHFTCFLFELANDDRVAISEEEAANHEPVWLDAKEMKAFRLPGGHRFLMDYIERNAL